MNMSNTYSTHSIQKIAEILRVIGQPSRIELLLAIGAGEACVCHLEAATGWRQAFISQHLMALRSSGLVLSRRDGRNMYYRLKHAEILDLVHKAASVLGITEITTAQDMLSEPLPHCTCPNCSSQESVTCIEEELVLTIGCS